MIALIQKEMKKGGKRQSPTAGNRVRETRSTAGSLPARQRETATADDADPRSDGEKEPTREDLAIEESILKVGEETPATPATRVQVEEPVSQPRGRQRSAYEGDTNVRIYLREIGPVELLTPEQEVELAGRIKQGDKQAREQMIKANLRLVVKIAREYEGIGLPLLDLISEGNIGLMKAVERFDPAKGGKLSTYGSWWIKQAMKRALANQSKTIRLPVHMVDKVATMRRAALRLREELGREPTDEDLSEELGFTPRQVGQMRLAALQPLSLDAPMGEEDSNSFGDVVRDDNATTPYEQLEEKTVAGMLEGMVNRLPSREAAVLSARFGLDGGPEQTLEKIGRNLGVTRERIRQIQKVALKALRAMIEEVEAVHQQS